MCVCVCFCEAEYIKINEVDFVCQHFLVLLYNLFLFLCCVLQHFHDVAYSAVCKEDLLEGMDEFLDDSIVLPPGDWDEDLLLSAMHERNELRRRKG